MTKRDSTITGPVITKTEYTEWGIISYKASQQVTRVTEVMALAAINAPQLDTLQIEILSWEIVGKQPHRFQDVEGLPARALNGIALTKWIAGKMGMKHREVEGHLEAITRILEEQAKAGR